jgi:hypothetical protein
LDHQAVEGGERQRSGVNCGTVLAEGEQIGNGCLASA